MAKTSQEWEAEFLDGLKAKSGKPLAEWMKILGGQKRTKSPEIIAWLKEEHGFRHMDASMLAAIFKNGGKPVYASSDDLMAALFAGKNDVEPIYKALEARVRADFPGTQIVPTKGYVSFRDPREFAVAAIVKGGVRVGLDLGETPLEGRLEKSRSLGAMPRFTHMIELREASGVDKDVARRLSESHGRSIKPA
jgi:hypothetical protein